MALAHNLSHLLDGTTRPVRERFMEPAAQAGRVLTVMEEISESKLGQQLWHGQKLEALGRLATGIAHDFGNLVTVILGYSELLENQFGPGDPRHDLVVEIQKAGEQAERLTRQILSFARPKALTPQVLDVAQVLGSTEKMLRRLIGTNVVLSTSAPPGPGAVKMDRGQLQQIIVNLAINARDAMPSGGTLSIEIAPEQTAAAPGNFVALAVRDTGTGMSPAIRARIFEPFFTTKARGKGTGLGLSMVDDIVRQNGGHIEVQTEPGHGSTFTIFLPQAHEAIPATQLMDDSEPMPRGKEVVLLVEDEASVRLLVCQVLKMCGYRVIEAADGKDALKLAEQHSGPIDLLVTDVIMPHLGGCQLAEVVRARHAQLKVLYVSGHPIDYLYEQGARKNEFSFLQKPFTVGTLAVKVREVLDQQQVDTRHD